MHHLLKKAFERRDFQKTDFINGVKVLLKRAQTGKSF